MSDVAGETILVGESGKGDFQVEVRAGTFTVLMDKLIRAGGLRSGPNPDDLLSAAVGAGALHEDPALFASETRLERRNQVGESAGARTASTLCEHALDAGEAEQ